MAADRDIAVILAHLDRFSSRDLLQREFYRRGWPEKCALGAPPHFTENQHPRSPKPLGITIGGEYYPPGRWIPKHKLDQATPAERAMLGLPPGKPKAAAEDRPKERQPRQAKSKLPSRPTPQQPRHPAPADNDLAGRLRALGMLRGWQVQGAGDGAVLQAPGRQGIAPAISSPLLSLPKKDQIVDARLGEAFTLGNLEIIPRTIELQGLEVSRPFGGRRIPRQSMSYVLTFVARNISEGQVFSTFSTTTAAVDNFGNECTDQFDSELIVTTVSLGNEISKDRRPGESAMVMLAFDPALETATEYTWTIRTQISNQDEYREWRIRFSPNEVRAR